MKKNISSDVPKFFFFEFKIFDFDVEIVIKQIKYIEFRGQDRIFSFLINKSKKIILTQF
jgi:hypothetical protein